MSYGIQAINPQGEAIIDSAHPQFHRIGSYSLSPIAVPGFGGWEHQTFWYVDIASPTRPLLTIDIPETADKSYLGAAIAIHTVEDRGGGVWRVIVIATIGYTPPSNCLHAYVDQQTLGASGESWGLQVFDAAGAMVFDSGYEPLRPKQLRAGLLPPHWIDQPHTASTTYSAGDYFDWSGFDTTALSSSDIKTGSFTAGQHDEYHGVLEIGSGSLIMMPLWWRSGSWIYYGYRHVLAFTRGYSIENVRYSYQHSGMIYIHRTPNVRWFMWME